MTSEVLPLDFDALQKGDVISAERIETIYRVRRGEDPNAFRLKQLQLVDAIESARSDLLARAEGSTGCVVVMTDAEADSVTHRRVLRHVDGIVLNTHRRGAINRDGFDEKQKRVAETRDRFSTALTFASRKLLERHRREQLLSAQPEPQQSLPGVKSQ